MADDHNPWLATNGEPRAGDDRPANKGGPDTIEAVAGPPNVAWQTRARPPSAYEFDLAAALQALFESDVSELTDIVDGLNERGIAHPGGGQWTVENYPTAMRELAAGGAGGRA